jgi:hypothetical protein
MIVPVLGAIDVGTVVWIILIVIGVISSITRSARKGVSAVQRVQQRSAAPAPVHAQAFGGAEVPPVIAPAEPPPPVITVRKPVVVPSSKPLATPPAVQTSGTPGFRGMFQRGNLVNAVIAAEVLGRPKAFEEQSIWSPRHSAPSI